jgi:hypothetical protein
MSAIEAGSYPDAAALRLGEDDHGNGWVIFSGSVLVLLGCLNIIEGLGAINGSHFFRTGAHFMVGNLDFWGWVLVVLGSGEVLSGFGVIVRNPVARWAGVAFATLNGVAQLLFLPAYPLWSLTLLTLDLLVMHGLIVYGGSVLRPV